MPQRHQKKNKTIKKNQLKKNQKIKNKTKRSKVRSNKKRQEGAGLGDLVVPVALVATRELLRPSLEKRIKNRMNSRKKKNKKQSGGFVRHHSRFIPFKQELESNIMSVDDKIKSSIE